jgi:N-acetylmuramoyl-L-alanine amidase
MKNNLIRKNLRKCIAMMLLSALVCPTLTVAAKEAPKTIVIDPSCQLKASKGTEAIAPGAFTTTEETSAGVRGKTTGYRECEMNLQIAVKLKDILSDMGYDVLITRDENNVDMSNSERAMIANEADADLFIVIAAGEKTGATVICQSDDNPYNYGNYERSRLLSDAVLGSVVQKANSKNNGVEELDDKPIINWCACPTTIVEVGNLQDKDEEQLLVDDEYQKILAEGIAAGVQSYYSQR